MQNNDDQTCSFKKKKTFCEVFFFLERFIERFTNVIKKSNAFQKKKRCLNGIWWNGARWKAEMQPTTTTTHETC